MSEHSRTTLGRAIMLESEEERSFREVCRRFAENEIAPLIEEAETSGVYPRGLRKKAGDAGLLGLTAPEESGGAGAPTAALSLPSGHSGRLSSKPPARSRLSRTMSASHCCLLWSSSASSSRNARCPQYSRMAFCDRCSPCSASRIRPT